MLALIVLNMELTKTISRSFTRKLNLGNYESADFWSSYSEVVSAETSGATCKEVSGLLYDMAKSDVEQAIIDYKNEKIKAEAVKRIEQGGWPKENE